MSLAVGIMKFRCRAHLILLTKSGGYHGPACRAIRLSWPDSLLGKPLCAKPGETGLALVSVEADEYELALVPQHEERGDHLLTDVSDSLRVRGAVVLEGLL